MLTRNEYKYVLKDIAKELDRREICGTEIKEMKIDEWGEVDITMKEGKLLSREESDSSSGAGDKAPDQETGFWWVTYGGDSE